MNRPTIIVLVAALFFVVGCQSSPDEATEASETADSTDELEVATLAGGCFWCMQPPFDGLDGVDSTAVGYTGGDRPEPTYDEVAGGRTDHAEAVEVRYDPDQITYGEILEVFWQSHDPTDADGQFADRGAQYRPAIFYHDDQQRRIAEDSRDDLDENGPFDEPIVTSIEPADTFWIAEEYHQHYYKKNPDQYQSYYEASGRAGFLKETWENDR